MAETWTTLKVLNWTTEKFTEKKLASARLDAEVLLAHTLATNRVGLYTGFDKPLSPDELSRYRELIKRRLAGEPVAYLVGQQEFWSLPLRVDARVLIPRRDTETLVELAVTAGRAAGDAPRIADVCTGSGAIALAVAKELATAQVTATDVSEDALAVARDNAMRLGLAERIRFLHGDLLVPLADGAPYDLILSNPPYVASAEVPGLAVEVRREPLLALDGGKDGLTFLRKLADGAPALLAPGGLLALEHGFAQGPAVRELLLAAGLVEVATTADLAGLPRVTAGKRAR
jgi:release factor glutamine methyltransferase